MTREEAVQALEFAPCTCDDETTDPACRHHQALTLARHALRAYGPMLEALESLGRQVQAALTDAKEAP
jgi:hypothetical protein